MTRPIYRSFVVSAALLSGAAAPLPPSAVAQLAAGRAHALELARQWSAHHFAADTINDSPVITSGTILNPTVNVLQVPDSPSIRFAFNAGPSGFSNAYFQFFGPLPNQTFVIDYSSSTQAGSGHYTIQSPGAVSQYAAPGTYTLLYAGIGNNAGGFNVYSGDQLAAMFPNLTVTVVNNGTPDTTVPTLYSGEITTPTISLSSNKPLFLANLIVSDTISGVRGAFVELQDPNGARYTAYNQSPSPIKSRGGISVGLNFDYQGGTALPTGTWTINSVSLYDIAGNYLEVAGPTIQQLFGASTFQVTR